MKKTLDHAGRGSGRWSHCLVDIDSVAFRALIAATGASARELALEAGIDASLVGRALQRGRIHKKIVSLVSEKLRSSPGLKRRIIACFDELVSR